MTRDRLLWEKRLADNMRGICGLPAVGHWSMFQTNAPSQWCVYPSTIRDSDEGYWFVRAGDAAACLEWKQERMKHRPWRITRLIVRAWRALPWR